MSSSQALLAKVAPPSLDSVFDFDPSSESAFINPDVSAASSVLDHWLFQSALPDWIQYLLALAAGVAVLSIVLAGLMFMWHPESADYKKRAYQTIIWSLAGLVIASLSYTIIELVNRFPTFGVSPSVDLDITTEGGVTNLVQGELLTEIIPKTIKLILQLIGTFAFGLLLYAGILMIVRDGDDAKIKKAKTILIYSLVGVIVAVFAYIVVDAVLLLNFERG